MLVFIFFVLMCLLLLFGADPLVLPIMGTMMLMGLIALLAVVAMKPDLPSNVRTGRSERPLERDIKIDEKKAIEAVVETVEEIRCAFCGGRISRVNETVQYCPYCGEILPRCRVCGFLIVHGDEPLQCPYCKAFAHKTHLIEWIKVKGYCPVCGVDVEEVKDFPPALFEERRTPIAKKEETLSPVDEKKRCTSCGQQLAETLRYCPFCGARIPHCIVCLLPIVKGDDFVKCPHCGDFAHREHLIEWIKVKGCCPHCRERLTELDIPS